MKVILSVEPVRFPLTGIGRYALELARGLQGHPGVADLKFFSGARFVDTVAEPAPGASHGLRRMVQSNPLVLALYQRGAPLLRQYKLRGYGDYLYHSPNYFLPAAFDGHTVATFHDLSPFKWAQCFDPAKVAYLRKSMSASIARADAVITDSEFTRAEVAEFFALSPEKVHAVPLAAGPEFRPRTEDELSLFLNKHDLKYRGYGLFVGTIEPRKNILRLLDAWRLLPERLRMSYPLVLSGYRGWKSQDIHERVRAAEQEGWVRYLGYLPEHELPLLFAGARVFAFPSLYEGFGLPVLEAMQSGVPVICSDRASLPEVVGEAGLKFDADDTHELSRLAEALLEDSGLWKEQSRAGLVRARDFSWEACVNATCDVYRTLAVQGSK